MKHRIVTVMAFLMISKIMMGQVYDNNFVKTIISLDSADSRQVTEVQFYDGLGRPSQKASNGLGTTGNYVYELQEYDVQGRENKLWLPSVGGQGMNYLPDFTNASYNTYNDDYGYSQTKYDPLGRVTAITRAGTDMWTTNHYAKKSYSTNSASDVIRYTLLSSSPWLAKNGHYESGSLTVETSEDEDGKQVQIFKDLYDNVVLERRDGTNDTYYVYDRKRCLRRVLPPMYQETNDFDAYCYLYEYDAKDRCIMKKLPGCDMIQYWYDRCDRVAYMQDGVLKGLGRYRFYLYDSFGRMVVQGLCTQIPQSGVYNTNTRLIGNSVEEIGYTIPMRNDMGTITIEKVDYYDDYTFLGEHDGFPHGNFISDLKRLDYAKARGLLTGHATMTSENEMLFSAIYYDDRGRVIERRRMLLNGAIEETKTKYTFTDKPLRVIQRVTRNGIANRLQYNYEYYPIGDRLKQVSLTYNNNEPMVISSYQYDELGNVSQLTHGQNALVINYAYNIRGALTDISGTAFDMKLYYTDGNGSHCYNGNIGRLQWGSSYYDFTYDGLNRMVKANYGPNLGTNRSPDASVTVSYDKNGNINTLTRKGLVLKKSKRALSSRYGLVDELYFTYDGNQLRSVTDSIDGPSYEDVVHFIDNSDKPVEYEYDENGNMTKDLNKNILSITYNSLNLPRKVSFGDKQYSKYVYNSDGEKMKAIYFTPFPREVVNPVLDDTVVARPPIRGGQVNAKRRVEIYPSNPPAEVGIHDSLVYCGNFIYSNQSLEQVLFDGGYMTLDSLGLPHYHFYQHDHLGSVRAVVDENGVTEERDDYYPFGATYGQDATPNVRRYKYNGKELDRMHGQNLLDYGARWYDPLLGRFTTMDPLCEKYYHISPYAYCANNPVNAVDPDGRDSYLIIWATGTGQYGHAAFAVDNYSFDKQTLSAVPDGTVTVYGLFPENSYTPSDALFDNSVNASYSVNNSTTISDIMIDGSICGEESVPDGIIRIKTDIETDKKTKTAMDTQIKQHPDYKGRSYNCSTFAREGVKKATGKDIKGEESFWGMNYVTPNALFEETKQVKGTTIVLSPGDKTKYEFKTMVKDNKNKKK